MKNVIYDIMTCTTGDLFKKPVLMSRAINVAFNWFANSIVYYGLSLNTGNLHGNPYLLLFFSGLAEIPGYILVVCIVDKTGRRSLCSTLMLLGGFACIIVAFISNGTHIFFALQKKNISVNSSLYQH